MSDILRLTEALIKFRDARDWKQFHNPKDLAAGMAIEASELQELFLWKSAEEIEALISSKKEAVSDELADVAWYVLLMAHDLGIDLAGAIQSKLAKNEAKYPVDQSKGSSAKYTDL
jgi:NTP pyrophosphatase (non-canonical NTP hydrolase)